MTPQEFAQKIRTKYPGAYDGVPDDVLTQKVVEKYPVYASQVNLKTNPSENSAIGKAMDVAKNVSQFNQDVGTGFAKGVGSTVKGFGTLGQTILDQTAGRVVNAVQGKGFVPTGAGDTGPASDLYRKGTELEQKASEMLKPKNTAQNIGYSTEKIIELFAPASKIAKAEKGIDLLIQGSGFLNRTGRVLAKTAISGVTSGGTAAAQTGSFKEGAKASVISGAIRGTLATIGEGSRALKIPEKLYSTIFKNSAKDMISELKAGGIQTLQKTNPEKYKELVKKGIIKIDNTGSPIVNDTLAEQALDRGLRGSVKAMADEVVEGALKSEDEVQTIAKNYAGRVSLKEPQFQNVFKKIASEYEDVGFGEIADEAKNLANILKDSGGDVSAEEAVQIKRFLDRVRIATSFDKPVVNLSTSQGNLKTLADAVRGRVNAIPGMGETMKNYSFYLDSLEALAREAARRGNNQVISMIDSLFLSGAYAGNNPAPGITLGLIRKLLASPRGATSLGQILNSPSLNAPSAGLLNSVSAGGQSLIKDQ